jgi:hypothetical protein
MASKKAVMRKMILTALWVSLLIAACDLFEYGQLGGADKSDTGMPGDPLFESVLSSLSGVWYSHHAGTGRLDGYRIGRWSQFGTLMEESGKTALFPDLKKTPYSHTGSVAPAAGGYDDYFVFYDDTVYGQSDDGSGGNGGWGGFVTRYVGIVRAVNIFNGNWKRGAIIIEYLEGGAPGWLDKWPEAAEGGRPFFGIYYRILGDDTVQMANAVDLAALFRGKRYYTETATLEEAVAKNTVENEAEFISWGVVIPQDRE